MIFFFPNIMTDCLQKCKTYRNGSEGKDLNVLPCGARAGQYFTHREICGTVYKDICVFLLSTLDYSINM